MTTAKTPMGRLPYDIREALCRKLRDRQSARQINDWLQSEGHGPYNDANFSNFRKTHYARWLKQQDHLEFLRAKAEDARREMEAAGETIYDKLGYDYAVASAEARSAATPENVAKLACAASAIIQARTGQLRAAVAQRRTELAAENLELNRQKFQRETAALFLKWFENRQAREIAAGAVDHAQKIEQLGQLMFGEDWND